MCRNICLSLTHNLKHGPKCNILKWCCRSTLLQQGIISFKRYLIFYFLTNFFCFWSSWLKLSLNFREFNLNINQLLNSVIWTKLLIFHAHLRLHKLVWGCKAPYKRWFRNHLWPRALFGVWNEYSRKILFCAVVHKIKSSSPGCLQLPSEAESSSSTRQHERNKTL